MEAQVRLDKYLWAIRVYKTRTEAADACRSGKVSVNGTESKASRDIKAGDVVSVRKGSVHFQYRVTLPVGNRVGNWYLSLRRISLLRRSWTSSTLRSRQYTSGATEAQAVRPKRRGATSTASWTTCYRKGVRSGDS